MSQLASVEDRPPGAPPSGREGLAIRVGDVAAMLGVSRSGARRLLTELEAAGLRRKGNGRGTHYERAEFIRLWREMDNRP